MTLCRRCLLARPKRSGLCSACLEYQRRTGLPRPAELIVRHADRVSYQAAIRRARSS
jgi:hypothetical protein